MPTTKQEVCHSEFLMVIMFFQQRCAKILNLICSLTWKFLNTVRSCGQCDWVVRLQQTPSIIFPLMCNSTCLSLPHSERSQSDDGRKKENPLSGRPSSCQPSAQFTCRDSGYEATTSTTNARAANSHKAEHLLETIEGDLDISPSSQREEGEGWDREQAKRLEERNNWFEEGVPFSEMSSRWDAMELKRGSVPVPVIETLDSEVNRKWVELEALSFRDAQALIGAQAHQSSTAQATLTVVTSQAHQSSPEEAATSSQTDILSSKEALPSINGAQEIQTNKAEALQKEVRKFPSTCFYDYSQYALQELEWK